MKTFTLVLLLATGSTFTPLVLPDRNKFESQKACIEAGDAAMEAKFKMKSTYPTSPIVGYVCFEHVQ